jgi:hypothetical protein
MALFFQANCEFELIRYGECPEPVVKSLQSGTRSFWTQDARIFGRGEDMCAGVGSKIIDDNNDDNDKESFR